MNNKRIKTNTILAAVIILVVFIGLIEAIVKRMDASIRQYVSEDVLDEAWHVSEKLYYFIDNEFTRLEMSSNLISNNINFYNVKLDGVQDNPKVRKHLLTFVSECSPSNVEEGVLNIDGSAIVGSDKFSSEYSGIGRSFRGEKAISYSENSVMFTVPIYNGKNISNVLYSEYSIPELTKLLDLKTYDGNGTAIVIDEDYNVIIPCSGVVVSKQKAVVARFISSSDSFKKDIITKGHAIMYTKLDGVDVVAYTEQIEGTDLYIIGYVPLEYAEGTIPDMIGFVLLVSTLLVILIIIGVVYYSYSLTRNLESEELKKAKEEAETANRAKSDFLASMSHEIRTPLNAVIGFNDMILRESKDQNIIGYAVDVNSAANSLLAIINDVLDLSKLEAGKDELVNTEYDLGDTVTEICSVISVAVKNKGLKFDLAIDPELPTRLYGDDIKIRQCVMNLLTNAVKYTPAGKVKLSVYGKKKDGKAYIKFAIKDTGVGIKEENLSKLFVAFERLDSVNNRGIEGTGLGLSITSKNLELMGTSLNVDSMYGVGSTFSFEIEQEIIDETPVGEISLKGSHENENVLKRDAFIAPKARILAVDDNALNIKVLVGLLSDLKCTIDKATSGIAALELTKKNVYDLILLDHMMPEMDGIETLHAIRADENNKNNKTHVIALTANAISGAREMYLAEGFDDFMSKPFKSENLEKLIKMHLPADKIVVIDSKEDIIERAMAEAENGMPEIEGFNFDYALMLAGKKEMLYSLLEDVCGTIDGNAEELNAYLEKGFDNPKILDDYRIKVHSIKSTAALCGAMNASTMARMLEFAAKDNDIEFIEYMTPRLIKEMKSDKLKLAIFAKPKEDKPLGDEGALKQLCDSIKAAIEVMDMDTVDMAAENISKNRYENQGIVDELLQAIAQMDDHKVAEICDRIITEA